MATTWQRISDHEPQNPGERYRLVMWVRLPYPSSASAIMAGLRAHAALAGEIAIEGFETTKPRIDKTTGRQLPYMLAMTYTVRERSEVVAAGLDPRVILSILALIVGSLAVLALTDKHFERAVRVIGEEARETIQEVGDVALNPATLAFVVLAIFLITRKGG